MAIRVTSTSGEGERLLQRFKRLCVRAGIFRELRRREHYEKPSERRRRRASERIRSLRRLQRRKARAIKRG